MVKLSKRMRAVASLVTEGNRLADVGTDHGYVPIALTLEGHIPSAIAMDINQGPLDKAIEHIKAQGLENKIQTRLSDGVWALKEGEADTILIAGMGGELVIRILKEGAKVCKAAKELVLQPQSDLDKVRRYLRDNGYKIVDEDMIYEDGKFYPMMKVVIETCPEYDLALGDELNEIYDVYGPFLLKNHNPILRDYLVKEKAVLEGILENLKKQQKTDSIEERISDIEKKLKYNEKAYTILGA